MELSRKISYRIVCSLLMDYYLVCAYLYIYNLMCDNVSHYMYIDLIVFYTRSCILFILCEKLIGWGVWLEEDNVDSSKLCEILYIMIVHM